MAKIKPSTLRFLLVALYLSVLAYLFWTSSRYPALNEKAIMEGATSTIGIGFDEKFAITEGMIWYEEVLYSTLNWMYTNKQGMIFGILFAVGLFIAFSLLKHKTFKNRFLNAGFGMLLGAPLGVCVNCAAPVAQGMRKGGASVETSLATMVSSPTLNVVVLGMLFSLFPWYMVAVKLALTGVFILLAIPLLGKYFGPAIPINNKALQALEDKENQHAKAYLDSELSPEKESMFETVKWFVLKWIKSFWYIVKMTVPLMLLAGLLGNVAITLLPWTELVTFLPSPESGTLMIGLALLVLGGVGLFLPVPMAFDIIICAVLIAAGVPEYYVMVLLFTLGIFSIYSFFIVRQAISFKIALASVATLMFLGVVGALAIREVTPWNANRELSSLMEVVNSDVKGPEIVIVDNSQPVLDQASLNTLLESKHLTAEPVRLLTETSGIQVNSMAFALDDNTQDRFEKMSGEQLGLGLKKEYPTDFMVIGRLSSSHSMASGDLQNDGWQDLAVVSTGNLSIFANTGGEFVRQEFPVLDSLEIVTVAMVDINDDSWLDVVVTSEGKGNYYFLNNEGDFRASKAQRLPNVDNAWLTRPLAFADYDRDKDLDIVLGNYTIANYNLVKKNRFDFPSPSRNAFLINEGDHYRLSRTPTSVAGETLTLLWSDFDNDGWVDLIEANDFASPDVFFLSEQGAYKKAVKRSDKKIETSTKTTMSLISGDINNDLTPEIYIGEIALMGLKSDELLDIKKDKFQVCSELSNPEERAVCENYMQLLIEDRAMKWQRREVQESQKSNFEFLILVNNLRRNKITCDQIPEKWSFLKAHCLRVYESNYETPLKEDITDAVPSPGSGENVLLVSNDDGRFENKAMDWGIATGGYTWNAKFADLNMDGYLDLFIVNGSHMHMTRQSNFLYLNQEGKGFINRIGDYKELNAFRATQTYTYIDIDNDGDQDIITAPVIGALQVHINKMKKGNSIAFELHDESGNSFGIGSKIIIHYGEEAEKHQVREVLASGGHLSYDPYISYFGLGAYQQVEKVTIQWSTGEETEVTGPFSSGAKYEIRRGDKLLD